MKVGIIIGSVRNERLGESVAAWVADQAAAFPNTEFELIDVHSYDLPVFASATVPRMNNKQYDDARVAKFSGAIDACDAFIFVTPEYNMSVPGGFKNAVDHLALEWADKPIAFVGYSFTGATSALAHWRTIAEALRAKPLDQQVSINLGESLIEGTFQPTEANQTDLRAALTALVAAK